MNNQTTIKNSLTAMEVKGSTLELKIYQPMYPECNGLESLQYSAVQLEIQLRLLCPDTNREVTTTDDVQLSLIHI